MAAEDAGRGELTEFVSHHVLRHIDRDEFVAVMDSNGLADKVGGDHGSSGPGFNRDLLIGLLSFDDSFLQFMEDIRTFL